MGNPTRRRLLALAGLAPLAGGLVGAAGPRSAAPTPREKARNRYFPNLGLLTQDGKKVRFYDDLVKDKIVTINFFYTKCDGVCPGIMANLVKVQKLLGARIGRDIFMISITLKPEEDTPAELKKYAEMFKVGPGWTFLTGKPEDIELLRRSLGFTNPDPKLDKDKSQHIGNLRYGNEPLCLWAACPGLAHPEWIAESVSWVDRSRVKKS